jgi:ribonuclease HI
VETLRIYTDGGCSGNPGPGGWAYVIPRGAADPASAGADLVGSGGEADTTNNRMELRAVIEALREAERRRQEVQAVEIVTDSQYVKNGITTWIHSWKRNGWRTADKKPVKNRELWEELHAVATRVAPSFSWIKGHAGHEHNERCDELVQVEIAKFRPR